jgi:hypothetical protein
VYSTKFDANIVDIQKLRGYMQRAFPHPTKKIFSKNRVPMTQNKNNKSNMTNHILPTSSNLLGLCFVILNFIKSSKIADETIIDEISAVAIVFFFTSSLLSYVSMRSKRASESYEKTAEIIFLGGLLLLAGISVAVVLEAVR